MATFVCAAESTFQPPLRAWHVKQSAFGSAEQTCSSGRPKGPKLAKLVPAALLSLAVQRGFAGRQHASGKRSTGRARFSKSIENAELEELDKSDPGRSSLRGEWAGPAKTLFEEKTAASGLIRVYAAPSSTGGSWRRLRFNDRTEQSVVLLGSDGAPVRSALAFGYLKTLAAVGAATAHALGRKRPLRALVIGVGGGALPAWFQEKLGSNVDAVELDAAVLRAAVQAMGLSERLLHQDTDPAACAAAAADNVDPNGSLRVYCCDGVDFIKEVAAQGTLRYDVVVVDVFDGAGDTPPAFLESDFAAALGKVAHCAVINLTCPVAMWEEANEFTAPQAGQLAKSWRAGFGPSSGVWSVRVPEGQNIVMAVTSVGRPPPEFLAQEALEMVNDGSFAFDPVRRVAFRRTDW